MRSRKSDANAPAETRGAARCGRQVVEMSNCLAAAFITRERRVRERRFAVQKGSLNFLRPSLAPDAVPK